MQYRRAPDHAAHPLGEGRLRGAGVAEEGYSRAKLYLSYRDEVATGCGGAAVFKTLLF